MKPVITQVLLVALFAKNLVTPLSYVVVGVLTPLTSAGYLDLNETNQVLSLFRSAN